MDMNVDLGMHGFKEVGNKLYRAGEFYDAAVSYSKAIDVSLVEKDTESLIKIYNNRSLAYIQVFKYELALKDILQCEELDPTYKKGLHRKLQCHTMMGDMHLANKLIKTRQEEHSEESDDLWDNAFIEYEEVNSLLSKIERLMANEDYRTAMYYTDQLFEKKFRGPRYYISKAECLVELDRYEEAEKTINQIFKDDPSTNNPDALYVRGKCFYYLRSDSLKTAHELLKRALRGNPDHIRAQKLCKTVGLVVQGLQAVEEKSSISHHRQAFDLFTPILLLTQQNKNLHYKLLMDRSLTAFKAHMFSLAIIDCSEILKHKPKCLEALKLRAECYENLGNLHECYEDVQRLCSIEDCRENCLYLMRIYRLYMRSKSQEGIISEAYETLGVSNNASQKEITNAFRRLAKMLHPDKNSDQPAQVVSERSKRFLKVNEAYQKIINYNKKNSL